MDAKAVLHESFASAVIRCLKATCILDVNLYIIYVNCSRTFTVLHSKMILKYENK